MDEFNHDSEEVAAWLNEADSDPEFAEFKTRVTGLRLQEITSLDAQELESKQVNINSTFDLFDSHIRNVPRFIAATDSCVRHLHQASSPTEKSNALRAMNLLTKRDIPRFAETSTILSSRASLLLTMDKKRELIDIVNMCARLAECLDRILESIIMVLLAVERKAGALTDEALEESKLDKGKGKST